MKKIKTIDCVSAYNILKGATLGKMESAEKISIIKNIRLLKQIALDFETYREDAKEKLKGDDHDKMVQFAEEWKLKGDSCNLTDAEKVEVNHYFNKYGEELAGCLDEEMNKENELEINPIGIDTFAKLLDTNDSLSVEQMLTLEEVIC